jgi:hypothetical protein
MTTIVHRLPEFNDNELTNIADSIPAISKNPTNPMSIKSLVAYLPKNKNPVFLRKHVRWIFFKTDMMNEPFLDC